MRVLVVSNLYPPRYLGGYELLCAQVAEGLAARGHVVEVLTSTHGGAGEDDIAGVRVRVRRRLALLPPFGEPPVTSRRARIATGGDNAELTRAAIAETRPDVVFLWSQLRLTAGPAQAAEGSGAPVAYAFNDDHFSGFVPRALAANPRALVRFVTDRTVHRGATSAGLRLAHVACISRCLKEDLLRAGVPIAGAEVIYQGIPLRRFPAKDDPGALHAPARLLYAGQLHDYKGVHTLLRAVAGLPRDAWTLTIAGDGPAEYRDQLLRAAEGLPVRFLGRRPHDELPALYRDHDVFVFPSIWREPFGLTFLEAMASGCAVVATAAGGHGECLRDGENALVFPPDDADALAARLRSLLADPALARRLARAGRALVERSFTLDRYVGDLEAFLGRVVAAERAASGAA